MAFMRKASTMGFGVSKPWEDTERYDFVVRSGKLLWRIQVKSVRAKALTSRITGLRQWAGSTCRTLQTKSTSWWHTFSRKTVGTSFQLLSSRIVKQSASVRNPKSLRSSNTAKPGA